jgi:GNAT superfamily N-acetyltransferase
MMGQPFAAYAPRESAAAAEPPAGLDVVRMEKQHVDAVAAIRAERHGSPVREHDVWARSSLARRTEAPDRLQLLVALLAGETVGYACATRLAPSSDAPPNAIPGGFYLGGVVVRPEHRRLGIGRELTRVRLTWIFERADTAYYFQNAINEASRDLHEEFGFRELRRGIWAPGVTFTGGVGVLYGAERSGG